jgi:hypothetical protein
LPSPCCEGERGEACLFFHAVNKFRAHVDFDRNQGAESLLKPGGGAADGEADIDGHGDGGLHVADPVGNSGLQEGEVSGVAGWRNRVHSTTAVERHVRVIVELTGDWFYDDG